MFCLFYSPFIRFTDSIPSLKLSESKCLGGRSKKWNEIEEDKKLNEIKEKIIEKYKKKEIRDKTNSREKVSLKTC